MKYLKRFLEHFSIEGDDNTVKDSYIEDITG